MRAATHAGKEFLKKFSRGVSYNIENSYPHCHVHTMTLWRIAMTLARMHATDTPLAVTTP